VAGTRISTQELTPWVRGRERWPGASGARLERPSFTFRRRGPGAILDDAIEQLVRNFGACVGVATLVWLPFELIRELIVGTQDLGPLLAYGLGQTVPEAFSMVLVSAIVGARLLGRELTPTSFALLSLHTLPAVLLLVAPALILTNVSICACFAPFFLLMSGVILLPPILALESLPGRRGPFGILHSLRRAYELATDWSALGRFLAWFFVVRLIFGSLLGSVVGAWSYPQVRERVADIVGTRGDGLQVLSVLVGAVLSGLTAALVASAATVHYVDLRVRKEGLDLELALRDRDPEVTA